MYERIFDFYDRDELLCHQVSHKAALAYGGLVYYADETGLVEDWMRLLTILNVSFDEWKGLERELTGVGFIEPVWVDSPYGINDQRAYQIVGFKYPDRISRLTGPQWHKLRSQVFERDNYTCRYCGRKGGELECDHVIPIAKGGTNEMGNLITACKRCNASKRDKSLEEWKA